MSPHLLSSRKTNEKKSNPIKGSNVHKIIYWYVYRRVRYPHGSIYKGEEATQRFVSPHSPLIDQPSLENIVRQEGPEVADVGHVVHRRAAAVELHPPVVSIRASRKQGAQPNRKPPKNSGKNEKKQSKKRWKRGEHYFGGIFQQGENSKTQYNSANAKYGGNKESNESSRDSPTAVAVVTMMRFRVFMSGFYSALIGGQQHQAKPTPCAKPLFFHATTVAGAQPEPVRLAPRQVKQQQVGYSPSQHLPSIVRTK